MLVVYELQKSPFAPFYKLMRPMRLLVLELYEFSVIAAGDVYKYFYYYIEFNST